MARSPEKSWFLKEWRLRAGLTQEALAERAETSKGYLSEMESGQRRYNQEWVERFAAALGILPRELFFHPDEIADDPNRDPIDPELESEWRAATQAQRRQIVQMVRVIKGTGTDG